MKNSGSKKNTTVMHPYMQQLFIGCAESLIVVIHNTEEKLSQKYLYEDLLNLSHLAQIQSKVEENNGEEEILLDIQDWVLTYTAMSLHCIFFSEKSMAKMRSEVLAHPELGTGEELDLINERGRQVRIMVNDLEKRFGYKPLFRQRREEMTRRGWFKMMDPLPHYAILK